MLSTREREIIERCYAISIWHYRVGKAVAAGKAMEANAFQNRVRTELAFLNQMIMDSNRSTSGVQVEIKKPRRISRFFSRLIGRGGLA